MIVYKCAITGAELFTDTYPMTEADGLVKIKGKLVTRSKDSVDDSLIGGNASAEEPQESMDGPGVESGVNLILDNRLAPTAFGSKKEFTAYFKGFIKKLEALKKESDPSADMDAWRAAMTNAFKILSASFKDYDIYTGNADDPDGSLAYVKWEVPEGESDDTPFVYFFKEGLKECKV